MNVIGVIPARYKSSRFPGKPLADILGKTMIQRVYEKCAASRLMKMVIVATDDQRIFDEVERFGGRVKLTRSDHLTGTDRIAEVAADFDRDDIIINIQGDEPLIDPAQIDQLVSMIKEKAAEIGTLGRWINDESTISNANIVKVVSDLSGKAKYFSRAAIPFNRSNSALNYRQHIGIYGFRNDTLQKITKLPQSYLEQSESLEQLRWLENGYDIYIEMSDYLNIGVDTPKDLEHIVNLLKEQR